MNSLNNKHIITPVFKKLQASNPPQIKHSKITKSCYIPPPLYGQSECFNDDQKQFIKIEINKKQKFEKDFESGLTAKYYRLQWFSLVFSPIISLVILASGIFDHIRLTGLFISLWVIIKSFMAIQSIQGKSLTKATIALFMIIVQTIFLTFALVYILFINPVLFRIGLSENYIIYFVLLVLIYLLGACVFVQFTINLEGALKIRKLIIEMKSIGNTLNENMNDIEMKPF